MEWLILIVILIIKIINKNILRLLNGYIWTILFKKFIWSNYVYSLQKYLNIEIFIKKYIKNRYKE